MFVTSLDEVHESMHDKFVEHEKDGVKGFIDLGEKQAIDFAFNVKNEKKLFQDRLNTANEQLSAFDTNKKAEIEAARKEALAEAMTQGDKENIEAIYEQKMQDLEQRTTERVRGEVEQEFHLKGVQQQADMDLTEIIAGLKPKDDFSARLMKDHLKARQSTKDGNIVYFNEDGGASSLDKEGMLADLRESGKFNSLSSYVPIVEGGGNLSGSNGIGDPSNAPKLSNKTQDYLANMK